MGRKFKVVGFQKEYSMLDTKFKKVDEDLFNLGILVAYTSELGKGFIVKKQLKTTNTGTKFNYKPVENEEEFEEYIAKVREMESKINVDLTIGKLKDKIQEWETEDL